MHGDLFWFIAEAEQSVGYGCSTADVFACPVSPVELNWLEVYGVCVHWFSLLKRNLVIRHTRLSDACCRRLSSRALLALPAADQRE